MNKPTFEDYELAKAVMGIVDGRSAHGYGEGDVQDNAQLIADDFAKRTEARELRWKGWQENRAELIARAEIAEVDLTEALQSFINMRKRAERAEANVAHLLELGKIRAELAAIKAKKEADIIRAGVGYNQ